MDAATGPRPLTPDELADAAEALEQVETDGEVRSVPMADDARQALRRRRELPNKNRLGDVATAVVMDIGVKVLTGEIKVSGANAKAIAETFYSVARLEAGEPTSISKKLTKEETINAIKAMRDDATRKLKVVPSTG